MSGPGADAAAPGDGAEKLRACREAARRRLRERVGAIVRAVRAPLADVLRDHALVHLPPAAAARLRLVHPSWARALATPLFAVAHAAAPRRASGLFVAAPDPGLLFLPLDAADTVPSPPLAFLPASPAPAVLSSSHGVACCFSPADDAYFVCNPATGSWEGVPCPPCRITWPRPAIVVVFDAGVYNFGGDFTLVCAFESAPGSGIYCFAVFTSVTGAWWVADAVAPAEGLIPSSGVAAGGMAWWRTSIGTAVGNSPVTGRVELAVCPGDSAHWETGRGQAPLRSTRRRRWCSGWTGTVAGRWPRRSPSRRYCSSDRGNRIAPSTMTRRRIGQSWIARGYHCRGGQVSDAARRRAAAAIPGRRGGGGAAGRQARGGVRHGDAAAARGPPAGADWGAAAYAAHTNTLALVARVVLIEPPDDQEVAS